MKNIIALLKTDKSKKKLATLSFISLLIYFLITLSSYAAWFPGSTLIFVYSSVSGFLLRAFSSIFVIVVMICCSISWSNEINFKWLIPFFLLILISFIMIFVSQTTYSQLYRTSLYEFMAKIDVSVSFFTNIKMFASFAIDVLFGFVFVFVLPISMKQTHYYFHFFLIFILIMLYSCIFSFIKERDYYLNFFKGEWHYSADTIGSIFGNKQQWGIFLAPAFAISFILIFLTQKAKINRLVKLIFISLFVVCVILFTFCSIVAACKTSIVSIGIFFIAFLLIGIVFSFKNKRIYIFLPMLLVMFAIIGVFSAFMTVDSLHSSGISLKIYNYIISLFKSGETTGGIRLSLIKATLQNFPATNLFFGIPKGTFDAFTRTLIPELVVNVHTGIVIYFGRSGIFGMIIYLLLLFITIANIIRVYKNSPLLSALLLSTIISSFILNLSELEIIIMSASCPVLMYNLCCVSFPAMNNNISKEGLNIYEK